MSSGMWCNMNRSSRKAKGCRGGLPPSIGWTLYFSWANQDYERQTESGKTEPSSWCCCQYALAPVKANKAPGTALAFAASSLMQHPQNKVLAWSMVSISQVRMAYFGRYERVEVVWWCSFIFWFPLTKARNQVRENMKSQTAKSPHSSCDLQDFFHRRVRHLTTHAHFVDVFA
jgi:hypothetical protein